MVRVALSVVGLLGSIIWLGALTASGFNPVVLGVVLFVPWLVTAASLRNLTGFSERRARTHGPFGPRSRLTKLF